MTPRRTALAGGCGILGGLTGLFVPLLPLSGLGFGGDPGIGGTIHLLGYALGAVTVFAANAHYRERYGRGGQIVAGLLVLALVAYAASIAAFIVGPSIRILLGGVTGMAYLSIWLLGSGYGVVLWNHSQTSRLTAGLFLSLFPSLFILGLLTQVGFPGLWIETPIWLAFIALGYEVYSA